MISKEILYVSFWNQTNQKKKMVEIVKKVIFIPVEIIGLFGIIIRPLVQSLI